jgi:hypothetical protein
MNNLNEQKKAASERALQHLNKGKHLNKGE